MDYINEPKLISEHNWDGLCDPQRELYLFHLNSNLKIWNDNFLWSAIAK